MTLERRNALGWQLGPSGCGCFPDFGSNHVLRDLRLVSEPVGELIAHCRIRNARGHAQHFLQKIAAVIVSRQIMFGCSTVQQEFEVRPRTLELGKKRLAPLFLDERIWILTTRQLDYVHVEAFAYEQLRASLRG